MIEVFKTNVKDIDQANLLVDAIQRFFKGYVANFDLEDCDKILRVASAKGRVKSKVLIRLLQLFNCEAEVLKEDTFSQMDNNTFNLRQQ